MNVVVLYQRADAAPEISYAFRLFGAIWGVDVEVGAYDRLPELPAACGVVSYGDAPPSVRVPSLHVVDSGFFGAGYRRAESVPQKPAAWYDGLPVPFAAPERAPEGRSSADGVARIETGLDLVASAFFFATRYEEWFPHPQDRFGRFPSSAAFAGRCGVVDVPVVEVYARWLASWLDELQPRWRGDDARTRRPMVCLTHDVDRLRRYRWYPPVRTLGRLARSGSWGRVATLAREYGKAKLVRDPADSFRELDRSARGIGARSTYYFLAGGSTAYDGTYRIAAPRVRRLLGWLADAGHEIGLHSSFDAYADGAMLRREWAALDEALGRATEGVRQHFLRWSTPGSWRARAEAGFVYDATLSFADAEGFRAGLCRPFRPFDLERRCEIELWQVPLAVMDTTLHMYRKLSTEEAGARLRQLLDRVVEHDGVFVLLWHNGSFDEFLWPGWRAVYEDFLELLPARARAVPVAEAVDRHRRRWSQPEVYGS